MSFDIQNRLTRKRISTALLVLLMIGSVFCAGWLAVF